MKGNPVFLQLALAMAALLFSFRFPASGDDGEKAVVIHPDDKPECRVPGAAEKPGKVCWTAAWSTTQASFVPKPISINVSIGLGQPVIYRMENDPTFKSEQFIHNTTNIRWSTNVYVMSFPV